MLNQICVMILINQMHLSFPLQFIYVCKFEDDIFLCFSSHKCCARSKNKRSEANSVKSFFYIYYYFLFYNNPA